MKAKIYQVPLNKYHNVCHHGLRIDQHTTMNRRNAQGTHCTSRIHRTPPWFTFGLYTEPPPPPLSPLTGSSRAKGKKKKGNRTGDTHSATAVPYHSTSFITFSLSPTSVGCPISGCEQPCREPSALSSGFFGPEQPAQKKKQGRKIHGTSAIEWGWVG